MQVAVLDLATGRHKTLIQGGTAAEYARSGHLVYAISRKLFAVPFDLAHLQVLGDPIAVVHDLQMALNAGAASYSISHTGTLVYVPHSSRLQSLVWVDRSGSETLVPAPRRAYHYVTLSPDGTQAALEIKEEQDIYVWDFRKETLMRLTFDTNMDVLPAWTPDSRRVLFSSTRNGIANVYAQAADGAGSVQRLTTSDAAQFPNSVTPDGRYLLAGQWSWKSAYDIVQIPLQRLVQRPDLAPESGSGTVTPQFLVQTAAIDFAAMMSPDGRYFAYISFETGLPEIYVRPFPRASEGKWQVSSDGGTSPVWARSGRELFYLNRAGMLMSVAVQPGLTTFRAGTPTKLLETKYAIPGTFGLYAVSPDGSRFLMLKETEAAEPDVAPASMVAVLNWFEELKHVQPR